MNISTIPKIELHCHFDGIISPEMVDDIRREVPDYPLDSSAFDGYLPVSDLDSFFKWWEVSEPIEGVLSNFQPILQRYIAQLKAQSVDYFELMMATGELPRGIGESIDILHAFREWTNKQEDGQIQVEFLIAINRRLSQERISQITDQALALHDAGLVCGVAFAGPEIGNPVKLHQSNFARLHEAGVGIEIHAGEWVGAESVWDALNHGFPDRIGHGVNLFQDPALIEVFQERQIHIEMCPTSNLKTGSIDKIENHPVQIARERGLNFGINTDDPGPFDCSMDSEYQLLVDQFGFTVDDFDTIYKNSLEARFQKTLRYIVD